MNNYPISIRPFGVHAVLIEWPNEVAEPILHDILQFMEYLRKQLDADAWEMVPAYNSLTLILRKKAIDFKTFGDQLHKWYSEKGSSEPREKYRWRLPVCYDADFGVDLKGISDQTNRSVKEIISLHTQNVYTVYGIGFLPGFMYLGGLPKALEIPRRKSPRLKVPKGSVGLAGRQTGIYPQESPGGWNLIGNCSVPIFNAEKDPPSFVSVGDQIQFYAISRAEYDLHKIEGEVGIYKIEKIRIDG